MEQLLGLRLFCLQGFPHAVGNGALIQGLVGLNCHFNFISHPHEEEASLSAVDGYLADALVEGLTVKFFSDGANTSLSGLSLLQFLVELFLEDNNVESGGRDGRHVLDPKLPGIAILSGR